MPSLLHQIRRGIGHTISGTLPSTPMPIGTPLGYASVNVASLEKVFGLANGCANFKSGTAGWVAVQGFQSRDSRGYPGLNDTEMLFGFGLETPFYAGTDGSIEPASDIEVEGVQYVLSSAVTAWPDGTTTNLAACISSNALTTGSAVGTELTLANGLFAAAASGDYVSHLLLAQLTPVTTGNIRIFASAITGYHKP